MSPPNPKYTTQNPRSLHFYRRKPTTVVKVGLEGEGSEEGNRSHDQGDEGSEDKWSGAGSAEGV